MAEKEKKSSIYKGNKLNTFSDEKNKTKQAEIYPRLGGPTQTREEQALSSRFGFRCLCSREDTIMTTQTWQQQRCCQHRRRKEEEGGNVKMEMSLEDPNFCAEEDCCMPMMVSPHPPGCDRGTRFLRSSLATVA